MTVWYGLEFALSMPTFIVTAVYFVREVHMSPLQLVAVGTVMEAAVFLFEAPTGAVADTYGRRLSLIVSLLLQGTATIVVGSVPIFIVIVLAWGLWGFGYTFEGAYEAWITDEVGADRVGPIFLRGTRLAYFGALARHARDGVLAEAA
jgi:MFS transporter, DHA3 family, tetracycline resistance protein